MIDDDGELKVSKLPKPTKQDASEKVFHFVDNEGDDVTGYVTNPLNPDDPEIGKKIKLEQVDYNDYGMVVEKWGDQDIKDKKMDEFVNTSYNQTQKEILSELTAFDRKESEELVSKLQKAWMEQNWEEYDRIMIENGINSNISVKAKAYENTKTYKTTNMYGEEQEIPIVYQKPLFSSDTVIDQLMFKDNPEALAKLTPAERETLEKMKNTGVPMNAANFPGTYKSIDLSTKKTPFTPIMIIEGLKEVLGEREAERFLNGDPSKEEIQRVTRMVLEVIQRPPLTTLMAQCVKECRQMIANVYGRNAIASKAHLKGTPEYDRLLKEFQKHAQKLLDDDKELKQFMNSFFIKGRMIGDPEIKLPYDKYDIPVLNFYFEKYDDFSKDVADMENNVLLFDDNYRMRTGTNIKIRKVILETFELVGIDFIEVFKEYLKRKNESTISTLEQSESGVEETAIRKEAASLELTFDDEDEIW